MIDIDTSRLQQIIRDIGRSAMGVDDSAKQLTSKIKQDISGPSPSAPGQPPGRVTGQYLASWGATVEKGEGFAFTTGEQGPSLEYGTETIAARPHARPAALQHQKAHTAAVRKALEALL